MFHDISENLKKIQYNICEAKARYRNESDVVKLMAVTKTVPYDRINYAISQGVDLLGENRVQEYLEKKDNYDKSADVHFIGHLQSNKVKYIADSVKCIHSVDSFKLALEIDRIAASKGIDMDILIEVNIGGEDSKSGALTDEVYGLISEISALKNVKIKGLMTIPPRERSEFYFDKMNILFSDIKSRRINNVSMDVLSMGMSGDYVEAIKHGSNIVRIGSALFGARK